MGKSDILADLMGVFFLKLISCPGEDIADRAAVLQYLTTSVSAIGQPMMISLAVLAFVDEG
jgi:hypothetical protein